MKYKKFKIAGLALMLSVILFAWSDAETLVTKEETPPSITGYLNLIDYQSSQKFFTLAQSDSVEKPKVNMDVYSFKQKSTKRGFLYSLILPGAGEFYAGSKIKAVLFFGLEAAFWTGYFSYHKKGKDKEDEFLDYADANWDVYAYSESLANHYAVPIDANGIVVDTPAVYWHSSTDSIVLSHSVHPVAGQEINKDQQYYEMIGKYDQFQYGWVKDGDVEFSAAEARRNFYLDLRYDSNSLLDKANRFVMISLANHLLSAFDAAIAVRSHNRKGERFSEINFKLRLAEYERNEIIPKLVISTNF